MRGQKVMGGGEGAPGGAARGSRFDLGWAEKAEIEQREKVPEFPKDALFQCVMQIGVDGRFLGKIETVGADERRWAYVYDGDGRLVEARLDGQVVERYAYDHEGRRITSECRAAGSGPVQYSYDALDRMRSRGEVQFVYDADGRMVERVERGLSTRYAYDAFGFLAQVLFPGGQRLTYDRGADGLLRSTWLGGQPQEEFTWLDGLRLERWRDVSARRTLEFHYEKGRRTPRAITVYEGGYSYRLALGADNVGTIKTVADDTGYLIKELQYDSFGNQLEDSKPGFYLPLGFAGGIRDRHTGLVRFGWRYYMPEAGRFTAPDPARWAGGDPDLYDYCVDDPIGKIDPQGLEPEGAEESSNQVAADQVKLIPHDKLYWTFKPKPEACGKCQAMKDVYFEDKPSKQVHPNCKCEIVGVEAAQLPYDRNRIIVPPGVDLEENMAEAKRLGKEALELLTIINASKCIKDARQAGEDCLDLIEGSDMEMLFDVAIPKCIDGIHKKFDECIQTANRNIDRLKEIEKYFYDSFRRTGKYNYKKMGRQYEPFGNYHYGMYTKVMGLPEVVALAGAGWYQYKMGTHEWKDVLYFLDDPNDQHNIKRGMDSVEQSRK